MSIADNNNSLDIEVDGGLNFSNLIECKKQVQIFLQAGVLLKLIQLSQSQIIILRY